MSCIVLLKRLPSTTRLGVKAFPLTLTASTPLEALQLSESSVSSPPLPSFSPPPTSTRRYPGIDRVVMELSEEELAEANELSVQKRHELMTNKFIKEVMSYCMTEVCRLYQITEEEYKYKIQSPLR